MKEGKFSKIEWPRLGITLKREFLRVIGGLKLRLGITLRREFPKSPVT